MKINPLVLDRVKNAQAKLLVVSKYWDKAETEDLRSALKSEAYVYGWGENRTSALTEKELPRAETHFIGRLQSRQFPVIVQHCETIHSLASLKHAEQFNTLIEQNNYSKIKVFVQVNVSGDPSKEGIKPEAVPDFLHHLTGFQHLAVIGLSSMGWGEFTVTQKEDEFRTLLSLRDQYLPNGLTSAGTSRDYEMALKMGIDIVRVGRGIVAGSIDV